MSCCTLHSYDNVVHWCLLSLVRLFCGVVVNVCVSSSVVYCSYQYQSDNNPYMSNFNVILQHSPCIRHMLHDLDHMRWGVDLITFVIFIGLWYHSDPQ